MMELTFTQGEARGRNGWFNICSAILERWSPQLDRARRPVDCVSVGLRSRRAGRMYPVHFYLPVEDARRLAEAIIEMTHAESLTPAIFNDAHAGEPPAEESPFDLTARHLSRLYFHGDR